MRPRGAVSVAGVGIDLGPSFDAEGWGLGVEAVDTASPAISEHMRAYPKYSPDLLAEKIKYTFSAALNASFNVDSLCDCVAQMPLRTLASRSCSVRLFTMKNFSGTFVVDGVGYATDLSTSTCIVGAPPTMRGSGDSLFVILALAIFGAVSWSGVDLDGPIVADALVVPAEPLLRRQTKRTPWNLESWNRFIAATQAASDL